MRYLRYLLILMGLWLVLADDIGRALGAPSLTIYAHIIVLACTLLPILFPSSGRSSHVAIFSAAVFLLLILHVWEGGAIEASSLRVIGVEIVAIGLTVTLASMVGAQIKNIEDTFAGLDVTNLHQHIGSFESGQHSLYRQVRWARRNHEFLALLAISINQESLESITTQNGVARPTHRLVKGFQSEMWRAYAQQQLATLILNKLSEDAIVTQRQDHFIVALTEVNHEQSHSVVQELRAASEAKLGLRLDIGVAIFPTEAVTFEALLEQAESAMAGTQLDVSTNGVFRLEAAKRSSPASNVS